VLGISEKIRENDKSEERGTVEYWTPRVQSRRSGPKKYL
jgi:hypothetical protein